MVSTYRNTVHTVCKHTQCYFLYSSCTLTAYSLLTWPLDSWRRPVYVSVIQFWASLPLLMNTVLIIRFNISFPVSLRPPGPVRQSAPSWQPLSNGDSLVRSQGQAAASASCKKQQHRARYVVWSDVVMFGNSNNYVLFTGRELRLDMAVTSFPESCLSGCV